MIDTLTGVGGLMFAATGSIGFVAGQLIAMRKKHADKNSAVQKLIDNMADGIYRTSLDGKLLKANPAFYKINGFVDQQDGSFLPNGFSSEEWYVKQGRRKEFMDLVDAQGAVENFVSEVRRVKNGERIWISESGRLVLDDENRPLYYEGMIRECTNTVKLLEMEESFRKYADNTPGVLVQARWSADDSFSIPFASKGFATLIGMPPEKVRDDAGFMFRMVHEDDFFEFSRAGKQSAIKQTCWHSEFRVRRNDGTLVWLELNATPELGEDGSCTWYGFLMDVTERKQEEYRLHTSTFYDPLTKLVNRRRFIGQLKMALGEARRRDGRGAVLVLDLDNFGKFRKALGSKKADRLLVETSGKLTGVFEDDGLVARVGGDQFAILMKDLPQDKIKAKAVVSRTAERLLKLVHKDFLADKELCKVTCSIGVAAYSSKGMLPVDVLNNAEGALAAARSQGGDYAQFAEDLVDNVSLKGNVLAQEMLEALASGQFSMTFQSQVNKQGQIVGAEAFLVWNHLRRGRLKAQRFIEQAELSGVILPLSDWVLKETFGMLRKWKQDPVMKSLGVSLNLSIRHFQEPDFADRVKSLLEEFEVDPKLLTFEVTEHIFTSDPRILHQTMTELRELGIRFLLDNFGTGYSSFLHLKGLPIDAFKLSGDFVTGLEDSAEDQKIACSILATARAMGKTTVGERIETEFQREFLRKNGCDIYQGFLIGRPMPEKEFVTYVKERAGVTRIVEHEVDKQLALSA